MKLYEKFASELIELIRNGTLKGSEKLPSIRHASKRYGISQATVIEAYYILETQGLVFAKDRSGFYVKPQINRSLKSPKQMTNVTETTEVNVSNLIFATLQNDKGSDTINFGTAFPSPSLFPIIELSQSMNKAMRHFTQSADELIIDMPIGNLELVRQIELCYRLSGTVVSPDEIIITNGAMEALSLSLQVVTKAGDLVAIESPAFYATLQILERLQLKAVEIPVDPISGMDISALAQSIEHFDIKAVVLMTSFQNPLGATLSDEKKEQLIQLVQHHQLPTIVDDVYGELYFGKTAPISLKSMDEQRLIIHCSSFSKSLSPGFRIGWLAGGRYTQAIERLKLTSTLSPSMPAQLAIAYYLQRNHYDRHLQKLRYILALSQRQMLAAIARYFPKNIAVTEPKGGYFLWVELHKNIDALELYKQALEHKISIAPGPIFSASQKFKNCIRLNYGMEWTPEIENAIKKLGLIIKNFN